MELSQSEAQALHNELMRAVEQVVLEMASSFGPAGSHVKSAWNARWERETNNAIVAVLKPKIR